MVERTDPLVSAVLYSVEPELSSYIQLLLQRSQTCVFEPQRVTESHRLWDGGVSPVALIALNGGGAGLPVDSEFRDCQKVFPILENLRQKSPFRQTILLIGDKLPLEYSCRFVRLGINAIVNYQHTEFVGTLNTKVITAYERYLELADNRRDTNTRTDYQYCGLVGSSEELLRVIQKAQRAARVSDAPVIIYGESGTGKQLIAEYIHQIDEKRKHNPFVNVNCSAIAGTLAESELFGHRKGAFTGATEDRLGYFRAAEGGTILLDEISELEPALQPKILRVLQESVVLPVGSDREHQVDIRVIAATNRDLRQMVQQEKFRLDLYQRLNVIQLHVPSLRQRIADLPVLFETFLRKYRHYYGGEIRFVAPEVYDVLTKAVGRGNIRELENIVRQMLVFKERGDSIELTDLPPEVIEVAAGVPEPHIHISDNVVESIYNGNKRLSEAVDEFEKIMLERLIRRGVNQSTLADRLGITRRTLYNKIKRYHLH